MVYKRVHICVHYVHVARKSCKDITLYNSIDTISREASIVNLVVIKSTSIVKLNAVYLFKIKKNG